MKSDKTKPLIELNEIADLSDEEEFESLNNQLDELNTVLDMIEEKNDNIKERLFELLQIVKVNREAIDQVESNLKEEMPVVNNELKDSLNTLSMFRNDLNELETDFSTVLKPLTDQNEYASMRNELDSTRDQLLSHVSSGTSATTDTANDSVEGLN